MDYQIMEIIKQYTSREELFIALSDRLEFLINSLQKNHNIPRVLLSGGSTPLPVYQRLSQAAIDFSALTLGLVDDRFVPTNDAVSNEGALRTIFSHHPSLNIIGMVSDANDYEASVVRCNKDYKPFIKGDIAVLGMGNDGHFASLFPNDIPSTEGLQSLDPSCIGTNAPVHPVKRISTNLAFLQSFTHRILLITGEEKLNKLKNAEAEKTPISYIYNSLTEIYYAP